MIKIGRNENDTFQLWKKWYESDPNLCSSIGPKKKAFNEKFEKHPDGPEHFIGDCNEMMKIMMDICK